MYCIECGTKLEAFVERGRERRRCPACGWIWRAGPPVGVAALVRDEQARVLLVRRKSSFRPGAWCVPCGYLEGDEELRAGAARELLEETGLQAEIGPLVAAQSNLDREPPYALGLWFAATPIAGTLRPGDDCDAAAFFALDELPELAFPSDQAVLAKLDQPGQETLGALTAAMHDFVAAKGWYAPTSKRPQLPRNLAISLALEAGEVLEHFQWGEESKDLAALAGELADVQLYLLQLADISGIDLGAAVRATLARNAARTWDAPAPTGQADPTSPKPPQGAL